MKMKLFLLIAFISVGISENLDINLDRNNSNYKSNIFKIKNNFEQTKVIQNNITESKMDNESTSELSQNRDCDSEGGNSSWIGDGYCDDGVASSANNNTEACQYDGGDCCCMTCIDDVYMCDQFGPSEGSCLDPAVDANEEASCLDQTCEDEGLVTCWDGSCATSEADCPLEWATGMECGTGQDGWPNCGDEDEDGVDDCAGLVLGCGLAYCVDPTAEGDGNCDDYGDLNGDGINNGMNCEYFNLDGGDCAAFEDCANAGGNVSWLGDGYCDSGNNNESCGYDNGDCCCVTCVDATYDCDAATGPQDGTCLDPAVDSTAEADCLEASCEDEGLVTCWDGSCAATEAECPTEWATGMECGTGLDGWPNCGDADGDGIDDCAGLVLDCTMEYCVDLVSVGDGSCDSGQVVGGGLNCEYFDFDGGDCVTTDVDCDGIEFDNSDPLYSGTDTDGDGILDIVYDCIVDNGNCEDVAGLCPDGTYTCPDGVIGSWAGDGLCDDGTWGVNFDCEDYCFDFGDCGTEPDPDCTIGGPACMAGDVNGDESINVSDIVLMVNIIINSETTYPPCADYTNDGIVNVLDIVQVVAYILGGGNMGIDASYGNLEIIDNTLTLKADGIISGIQMTISHSENFNLDLGNSYYGNYRTDGYTTNLVIINPENELLFNANSEFEIVEVLAANSNGYVDMNIIEPTQYLLTEVYPNPFNPTTNISLNIPNDGIVKVNLYNIAGEVVQELLNHNLSAGTHILELNGSHLPSGLYLVQTIAGTETVTNKIMLMK